MIGRALVKLRPGAVWTLFGDELSGLTWLDEHQTRPTDEDIFAVVAEIRAEDAATEYRRQRAAAYPAIADQLDALFHAGVFPPEMAAQIQAVKDRYPRPKQE
jgi:hypothetical protein